MKSTPRYSRSAGLLEICIHVPVWSGIWSEVDINHRVGFMMGWTPPDSIGVPKVEVLSTT